MVRLVELALEAVQDVATCRKPAFSSAAPASSVRLPLRQMSTTGRSAKFAPAIFFTWPTKCGLSSHSGPSYHGTIIAPTGWPTNMYSISLRQSTKIAFGCSLRNW